LPQRPETFARFAFSNGISLERYANITGHVVAWSDAANPGLFTEFSDPAFLHSKMQDHRQIVRLTDEKLCWLASVVAF
tara:strand:- start:1664 stop:1897 length:234 start_codon:yes stop_codon:yes gene_type:complete